MNARTLALSLLCSVALTVPGILHAQEAFTITSFDTVLNVQEDSAVLVTETLDVDFGENQRHGIFRTLPTSYRTTTGAKRNIRLSDLRAEGDPATIERSFGGDITLKIGDPDIVISGRQQYVIHYRIENALNEFPGHIELYWNATGTEWGTTIDNASAVVILPGAPTENQVLRTAYQGELGSQELAPASYSNGTIRYASSRPLQLGEGLTIVAGMPKSIVSLPSPLTRAWWFFIDNWLLGLPIITLIILIGLFRRHGQDPRGKGTIVPVFAAPKDVTLLETGALRREDVHGKDLTALIISWAVAGALTIHEPKKGEYEFAKKNELPANTPKAEQELFKALFKTGSTVQLKDIQHNAPLIKAKSALEHEVLRSLIAKKYIVANPRVVRAAVVAVGALILFSAFFAATLFGLPGLVGIGLSGLLIMIAAPFMPKRTEAGVHKKEEILGFELYLKTAERYRMKFAEEKNLFERYLPYAITLGVAGLWAKAFKDIATEAPSWYSGYYGSHWSTATFANSLNSNLSGSLAGVTTASSGGSGFSGGGSGGGFGGGGGGSW